MTRMYSTPEEHLKHYPYSRRTTLAHIETRLATTRKLERENEEEALRNKPRLNRKLKQNAFRRLFRWPEWVWRW